MVGTLRRELLDRLLIVNEHHLRRVLTEYLKHYNTARPHRSLNLHAPDGGAAAVAVITDPATARMRIRPRRVLGGLINEYQRVA